MRKFLIGLLGFAGVMHFVKPEGFDSIVPEQLPLGQRAWTYGSGVAEIATAALLSTEKTRRMGGLATAILMVAVWPGNFQMAWNWRKKSPLKKAIALIRLPLQIPLIMGGWKIYTDSTRTA
ncbi:MauE/DoxX family redox-associated membrane protein [Corynebacterium mendelii]|uniref:Methylamine utilisation protein MauE domain-containing protein n=1 Tax=Corynebacterium mendelii TaxID=2765362 RepID=A0A939E0I3_9CORY|nr:MauE/DoxX family redox-associated membrane protein [Corynebacterium mendelii]MBN9644204.1 hypothetical protein [Corynebacterium mendelii]